MRTSPRSDWQLPGLRIAAEPVPDVAAKFDLTLAFRQDRDADGAPAGISAVFEYAADLFDQATVRGAGRPADPAAAPGRRAIPAARSAQLDVLTAAERRRLLRDWNDTARPVPAATLPELFEAQVARTPDALAVVCGGRRAVLRAS